MKIVPHGSPNSTCHGLKFKKRLIEYFAMVRLKELNVAKGARKAATFPAAVEKPVSKLKFYRCK